MHPPLGKLKLQGWGDAASTSPGVKTGTGLCLLVCRRNGEYGEIGGERLRRGLCIHRQDKWWPWCHREKSRPLHLRGQSQVSDTTTFKMGDVEGVHGPDAMGAVS